LLLLVVSMTTTLIYQALGTAENVSGDRGKGESGRGRS
jgi:hypothetical protein